MQTRLTNFAAAQRRERVSCLVRLANNVITFEGCRRRVFYEGIRFDECRESVEMQCRGSIALIFFSKALFDDILPITFLEDCRLDFRMQTRLTEFAATN